MFVNFMQLDEEQGRLYPCRIRDHYEELTLLVLNEPTLLLKIILALKLCLVQLLCFLRSASLP